MAIAGTWPQSEIEIEGHVAGDAKKIRQHLLIGDGHCIPCVLPGF